MSAKKQFHREYPEDTKRISREFRGICERDYPKIEAYLGLKKYLLRTFGVTLNIHSQKTKGDFDKNTDEP